MSVIQPPQFNRQSSVIPGPQPSVADQANAGVQGQEPRRFKSVHDIQEGRTFADAWRRVDASREAITDRLGKKVVKYYDFDHKNEQGITEPKLRLRELKTSGDLKKNAENVRLEFAALREALADTSPEYNAKLADLDRQQQARLDNQAGLLKGWWNKFRDIFTNQHREVGLDITFRADQQGATAGDGKLVIGITKNEAGQAMLVEQRQNLGPQAPPPQVDQNGQPAPAPPPQANVPVQQPNPVAAAGEGLQPIDVTRQNFSQVDDTARRGGWRALGGFGFVGGAGAATAGGLVTWAGLGTAVGLSAAAAPIVGVGLLAAGGLTAGYLVVKWAFGKRPWWGQTELGKMQKAERVESLKLHDEIRNTVKQQVLRSPTQSNLDVKHGELQKRYLADDPEMMSDFIKLAREKNHTQLKKLVREQLLKPEKSFLSDETIKYAKKLEGGLLKNTWERLKAIGQGNEAGHAQKTLNRAVDAIVSGIETGICEGAIQIITGELSDNASVASQNKILEIAGKRKEEFAAAVKFLAPSRVAGANGDNDVPNVHQLHEIYEVDEREAALTRLKQDVVQANGQRLSRTDSLVNRLEAERDIIGAENVASYSRLLRNLDEDIDAHLASLKDVRTLLRMPADAAGQAAAGDPPVSVERINRDLIVALEASVQASAADTTDSFKALANDLEALKEKIASQAQTPNLIKAHADKLTELLSAVEKSVDACKDLSTTLSQSRDDLAKETTLADVKRVKDNLDKQLATLGLIQTDLTPANGPNDPVRDSIMAAVAGVQNEMGRISSLCDQISDANSDSTRLVDLQKGVRTLAKQSGFRAALESEKFKDFEANVALQKKRLGDWETEPNFKVPSDLKVFTDRDIEQLKIDMVADAIGLDDPSRKTLQPVLSRLADPAHESLIQSLKDLPSGLAATLLGRIATAITETKGKPEAEGAVACLSAAMRSGVQLGGRDEQRLALVQALFPNQVEVLKKFSNALEAETALRRALSGDLGGAILEWKVEKEGGGDPQPQTLANQLQTLQEFVSEKNSGEGLIGAIRSGRKLLGDSDNYLLELDTASLVARLGNLSTEDLRSVESLAGSLCEPLKKAAQELKDIKLQQELEARAAVDAEKIKLLEGAQPGAKVEEVVHQAAQAINNEAAALNQKGEAVKQQVNDIIENKKAISVLETERNNLAEELKTLIGSSDKTGALAARIEAHPETRQHLLTLIHANRLLGKEVVPEAFRASIRKEDSIRGAQDIAKTKGLSVLERENLKQRINNEASATKLFSRLDKRQTTSDKFKNKNTNETKPPKELAKILARDEGAEAFVKTYLDEEVAYNTLWAVAGQDAGKSSLHIRSVLEGNLTQQEAASGGNVINQASVLSPSNCEKLKQNLLATLKTREEALQGLTAIIQRRDDSEVYLGTFKRELARLDEIRKLIPEDIQAAFDDPDGGRLATLGGILREAQPFAGRSVLDIQKAYLSEQVKESRKALAWFNLKHLSVANGLFSRLAFVVARKGERLNRVLNTEKALAISSRIAKIARNGADVAGLTHEAEVLNEQLRTLQKQRDALVKDPSKVATALRMLAFEHLKAKGGGDQTLSEADVQAVVQKLQDMTGSGNFTDIEAVASGKIEGQGIPNLVGASVAKLVKGMSPKDQEAVASQLEALNKKEAEVAQELATLRAAATEELLKQGNDAERQTRRLMIRAGLDLAQGDNEHYETLAKGKTGAGGVANLFGMASTVNAELLQTQLTQWASLRRDLEAGEPATAVVARANALKRDWETKIIETLINERSATRQKSAQALLESLEFSLLEAIGPSGPIRLESGNSDTVANAANLKEEVTKLADTKNVTLASLAKFTSKSIPANSDFNAEPYTIESTLELKVKQPAPSTKNLAPVEARLMQLWESTLPAHLDASQASNPPNWALMKELIEARKALGELYYKLADSQTQLAMDQSKGKDAVNSAFGIDAPEVDRLRDRAAWHAKAAEVGGQVLSASVAEWAGDDSRAEVAESFGVQAKPATKVTINRAIGDLERLKEKAISRGAAVDESYVEGYRNQTLVGAMIGPR